MFLAEDDYRVEALIAFWLENDSIDLNLLTIQPEGSFKRAFSNDILEIEDSGTDSLEKTVHISREGLYDMLPEGIFHQAKQESQKSTKEAVEESERFRKEESAARQFFLPLEQEFYRQRIQLEHIELRTWLNNVRPESKNIFLDFWGVDKQIFTPQQCGTLLTILPNLHQIVGNLEVTAYCLEKVIMEPVRINALQQQEVTPNAEEDSRLGSSFLGVDSVLGGNWWCDEPSLEVTVGPLAAGKVNAFLTEGSSSLQLKKLYGYFFPAETTVKTAVEIEKSAKEFILNKEMIYSSRLNFTTTI